MLGAIGCYPLPTRTGLELTCRYPTIAGSVCTVPAQQTYLDGEHCGVRPDGITSCALIQNAPRNGRIRDDKPGVRSSARRLRPVRGAEKR
jgi:hypothetical protein